MADSCVLSTDAAGTAILWSLSSRNQVATFKDASSALRSVALVFGSRDDGREHVDGFISCLASRPSVHMFSVAKEQPTFKCGVPEVMHSVAVSADGAYCVCGGASGRAFLWELASGALLRSWSAHYKRIGAAAFSPCGTVIVTGGDDGVVQVWAVAALVDVTDQSDLSAHPVATVTWSHHSLPVTSLRFGPGLGLAAPLVSTSLDRSARVWDVASDRCIFAVTCPAAVHCSAIDPLGRRLYLACADSGASSVCEVDLPAAAARSADPAAFLLTGAPGPGASTPAAAAAAASTAAGGGADVSGFAGHAGVVNELTVSPDGGLLLTAGQDGVVRLWDTESRSCIQTFDGHRGSPVLSMLLVSRSGRGLGGASDASGATVPLTPMAPLRKHQVPMAAEWKGSTTGPLDAVVVVARPVLDAAGASSASGGGDLGGSVFAGDLSALLSALDALAEEGATAASSHVADAVASSASVVSSELAELRRRNAELENDNRRWKAVNNALKDQLAAAAGSPGEGMAPASTAAASAAAAGVKRARNSATEGSSPHQ